MSKRDILYLFIFLIAASYSLEIYRWILSRGDVVEPISEETRIVKSERNIFAGTKWYIVDDVGIGFGADEKWKPANPSQRNTNFVIRWDTAEGRLVATCYIESQIRNDLSNLKESDIHGNSYSIVQSVLKNNSIRGKNVRLVETQNTEVDGHPVIYIVRDYKIENFGESHPMRTWLIFTVWRMREVGFECSSSAYIEFPEFSKHIEDNIAKVMKTIYFDR